MPPSILQIDHDSPQDRDALSNALSKYNHSVAPPANYQLLGLLLKSEAGETIGGLWGRSAYEWLFIELLFVPESLRGNGTGARLMLQAEEVARQRHLTGIWLDTFTFQALGFYQKLGYTIFGELKDHPRGISQFWLQKRLT